MATQDEIASAFLSELHAPNTPAMRAAVTAWMRAESGNTVRANNPWNMTLGAAHETGVKTCGSWQSASSGLTFAAFCSPQDGARASARLLLNAGHDWRKYDGIVSAARSGNPIDFLNALAHSAWDGGRYGTKNGGANKLLAIYTGVASKPGDTRSEGGGVPMATTPLSPTIESLGGWNNIVSFPVGHILTAADVQLIMAKLAAAGYFQNDPAGVGQSLTAQILMRRIGQPWNKSLQDSLQADFLKSASEAVPKTPLDPLFAVAGVLTQVVAALFDPRKWLLVLALLAGTAMTAYGGINILRAAA